jgi:hypothetical protein
MMEANRKEAEETQKLLATANQNRRLEEENRKLKLQPSVAGRRICRAKNQHHPSKKRR